MKGYRRLYAVMFLLALVALNFPMGWLRMFRSAWRGPSTVAALHEERAEHIKITPDPVEWNNIYGFTSVNDEGGLDPTLCKPPVWRIRDGHRKPRGESWTFAFAVHRMEEGYTEKLAGAVRKLRMVTGHDISVIVLRSGAKTETIELLERKLANASKVTIFTRDNPIQREQLSAKFLQALKENPNVGGEREYVKLQALALPYDKVLLLDTDVTVVKSVDHLFHCDLDFLYASGPGSPLNAGMFLTRGKRPDMLAHMSATLTNASRDYTQTTCFGGLGCGPCRCRWCAGAGMRCHGQAGPQGFLHFYFVKRRDPALRVARLSTCLYDFQHNDEKKCQRQYDRRGFSPFIVHKGPAPLGRMAERGLHPSQQPGHKACRVDFWIIGARKAGTTALYTWLTRHPHVQKLHIRGKPTDGEVGFPQSNVKMYNSKFRKAPKDMLVGDSAPGRLVRDDVLLPSLCGQRYTKYIVLLRDPVERCHSEFLQKARLGTEGFDMDRNLSASISQNVEAFEATAKGSVQWAKAAVPRGFGNWRKFRCIYNGLYGVHLKRWFNSASTDNFRIYFTEDFSANPLEVLRDALQFIGADPGTYDEESVAGSIPNSRPRYELPEHQQLTPLLRQKLRDTFTPYNRILEEVIGVQVPWGY